jgi:RNA polymerase sigma-70 factor (ECF subfamily)
MGAAADRTDAELLAATPADPEAFTEFYRRHVRGVWASVAREAARDDVGDVVAEVFATALVHRRRFDPDRGSAQAWLSGIARHKIQDARRRGAAEAKMCRRLGMRLPGPATSEDQPGGGTEVLEVLPLDQRRVVAARVLQDKSYAQIVREESVSEPAVRKRVSRALSALRSHLQEEP